MAFTPAELDALQAGQHLSPDTLEALRRTMQPTPPVDTGAVNVAPPAFRFDPTRSFGTGDQPPMGVPAAAPPSDPASLGTGAGAQLAAQLMANVRAQAGAPETISAPVGALARPPVPAAAAATPPAPRAAGGSAGPTPASMQRDLSTATLKSLYQQGANVERQRDFDMGQAQAQAAEMQRQNEALEASDAQARAEHAHRSQMADAALADLESRSKAIGEYREDPNHLWSSMGTGQKILAGIGMLVSGIAGHPEQAMQVLQSGIDRDIAAQRAKWQAKKDSVAAQHSAFGQLMQRYRDEDSAAAALRTLQLDTAGRKLQLMAAGSQSEAVRLRADQALTAINQQRAQAAYQFGMQQYAMAHPVQSLPPALKATYGDAATARAAYVDWLRANPGGQYADFVSQAAAAAKGKLDTGSGGDVKVSPRLQGMLVKDETINKTAEERAKQFDLVRGPDGKWVPRSALSGLGTWAGNATGDLFGTQAAATRKTTNETLVDERASAAAQGKPDAETMAQYRQMQNTNNPWTVAGILNEAERAGAAQKTAIIDTAKRSKVTSVRADDDEDERDR